MYTVGIFVHEFKLFVYCKMAISCNCYILPVVSGDVNMYM